MIYTIKERLKQRLFLLTFLQMLGIIGIRLIPFYIHREFPNNDLIKINESGNEPFTAGFLSTNDVIELYEHPKINHNSDLIKAEWIKQGCKCFALKDGQEIAAFMWCNKQQLKTKFITYDLDEDEAYLFGAFTFKSYRGRNLAPFIRQKLYTEMLQHGRDRIFSVTEYFNKPAINFKKKLGAKPVKLMLHINLFNKYQRNLILKNYSP
jgi:GNAT superfamily N-acetyltransferase